MKLNKFEKLIGVVSPRLAVERASYRAQYEGASQTQRTDGWRASKSKSADRVIFPAVGTLRDRSRDLVINGWIGPRTMQLIETYVVGTGIKPRITGGKPPTSGPHKGKPLNQLLQEYVISTDCDARGKLNLYGLQSLAMRTIVESGEVLIIRIVPEDDKLMPFRIRVLEPDHMPIEDGIEYDQYGKAIKYSLLREHPGGDIYDTERVSIDAADMVHAYRIDRAEQTRGVPWLAPILIKAKGLDEYDDAQLMRQKIAACFSAFVSVLDVRKGAFGGLGASDSSHGDVDGEDVQPGMITKLGPGESITFANPPGVDGHTDYVATQSRQIAVGVGVTYEAMTGDYSRVNFASGRMGHIQMKANVEAWRDRIMYTQVLNPWMHWFLETAALLGYDTSDVTWTWIAPHFEMIDPQKESAAAKELVRCGFSDMETQTQKFGREPEDIIKKTKSWNDQIDKAELKFDTDPRYVAGAGQAIVSGDTESAQERWGE